MPPTPRINAHGVTPLHTDTRLLERMRADDGQAFEIIFRRYFAALCRSAVSGLGDPDLTEDVVQGVLARLWEHRKSMEVPESLGAYLQTAVRRRAMDELRRQGVRERAAPLLVAERGATPDLPDAAFDAVVLCRRFERALAALSPRTREAFILSRSEGLSYNTIALRMGISTKTVGVHLSNSLAALRKVVPAIAAILLSGRFHS